MSKLWGPRLLVSESHSLAFKPAEKNLDLHEGHKFPQVIGEEDTVVRLPKNTLSCPLENDKLNYQGAPTLSEPSRLPTPEVRIRRRSNNPSLTLEIFKNIKSTFIKYLASSLYPMGTVTFIKRALFHVQSQAFTGLGKNLSSCWQEN